MRLHEIVRESAYADGLEGDVTSLLSSLDSKGIDSIEMEKVVARLNSQGYNVTPSAMIDFLDGNPLVQNVSADKITLKNANPASASGDGDAQEKNKDKVSALAQKAADKGIKD